ncbi:MAG: glycosyl hydrolase, partial [Gemmatimonadaceae bacterium]
AKNTSTALYSNISAVAESPKKEGMLYVGTDDGLIQVSEDGGATWRKTEKPAGVPGDAYVTRIRASQHEPNVAYASFSNHQNGDFKPYLVKTTDGGRTWTSIVNNLPERGGVFAINEDHVDPNLLFVGTEFGAYFSKNGGGNWVKFSGLPTIKVADINIQRRENDLVIATFGRGIYIIDDYSPLRTASATSLASAATLYQPKDAYLYVPTQQYGVSGKAFQGEMLYEGENPPFGAVFTYYLKDGIKTLREQRTAAEKAADKAATPLLYPTADQLRAEAEEETPAVLLTISDSSGKAIRTITGPVGKGMNRVAWDLRHVVHLLPSARPASPEDEIFGGGPTGPYVVPGRYSVSLAQRIGGKLTALGGPVPFSVLLDPQGIHTLADHQARGAFQVKLQELRREMQGAVELSASTAQRLEAMRRALDLTPAAPPTLHERVREQIRRLTSIQREFFGDRVLGSRSDAQPTSINERVNGISGELQRSLGRPTTTHNEQLDIASELFAGEIAKLRTMVSTDIPAIEGEMEKAGAPYTPGRIPR